MGDKGYVYRVLVWKPEERDQFGDPGVNGRIILRWIFRKWDVAGTCECGNEFSGFIKCGELLYYLQTG
jgi:hypothetical protein